MAVYTRQSSFSDGDTIAASLLNDEYDQLLAAFHVATGHTHNGSTTGDGGPLSTLYSNALSFGTGADADIVVTFNANSNDGVLTWMEDEDYFKFSDDILINSTERLNFQDTGTYIYSSTDGQLDLVADTEIQIAATTIDINGNVDISGNLIVAGNTIAGAEIAVLDGVTAGTVAASKAVVVDSNKDIGSFRNVTLTGELDAATLDISGNADIDGTLEADAYTVDGTALNEYIADTIGAMVSSNTETGITVTYEDGDNTLDFVLGTLNQDTTGTADNITVSANNSTDETVYPLFVDGATGSQGAESDTGLTYNPSSGILTATAFVGNITGNVTGNTSGTAATVTTAAQSNITSLGTLTTLTVDNVIVNGTTIGHTSDTDLITLADGNVTIAGELDLTTLDVSGNADIDGTLEADAITVDGTALNEYIADTVGAMVGSNTETGISVTYEDGDNTLDFVIGSSSITNAMLAGSIADSKLAQLTTADKVSGAAIQIDGATDGTSITLADTDKILVDDGGTTKYITASQLNTYTSTSIAADDISTGDSAITLATSSGNITIDATANNSDIIFKGTDATSDITMLTLDGSEAGAASFNGVVTANAGVTSSGTIQYGSLSDGTITVTAFVDEDNMSSDSATLIPTQQSVKAYVDSMSHLSLIDEDNMATDSATRPPSQQSVKAYVDAQILTEDTLAELNDTNITSPGDAALLIYDTGTSTWRDYVVSGDVTISDAGVAAIGSGVVVNADINASAAIADSKLATISTADKVAGGAIQIDSGTDGTSITLANTDKLLVDDGGATKYVNASQITTFINSNANFASTDTATALAIALG